MKMLRAILATTLVTAPTLHAQLVADGATNTLSNVTNNITGTVTVGTNGLFTLLVLSDNALLTNSAHGVIGRNVTAKSNEVHLVSATARWLMGNNLFMGSNGAASRLVISNGASLKNNIGFVGFNSSSSNNLAVITGPGSVWSNANFLAIGNGSQGNRMVVSNGAAVRDSSGYVGLDSVGNNLAVVTGSGSLWTNSSDMFVGTFGAGNRLLVSDGGAVRNNNGFVGIDASASNNLALVSSSGSVWSNALELYVGYSASRNKLVVSNGASVFTASKGFIGFNSTAISNSAIATDTGSRWIVASDLYVGTNGAFNLLVVSNGAAVFAQSGEVGSFSAGRSNQALVTGSGSVWSNAGSITVGRSGANNRLVVSNGGSVWSTFGSVGSNPGSTNNLTFVTDVGSRWTMGNDLFLGSTDARNQLVVSNGGVVLNSSAHIGSGPGGNNNVATVAGSGSLWSNAASLNVGSTGSGNQVVISNGGAVAAGLGITLGSSSSSSNNRVVVNGGALLVTNALGSAVLDVRRGTNQFNAGLIDADQLRLTNALSRFEFNGGMLITRGAVISNSLFVVGNTGNVPAVWDVRTGASNHYLAGEVFVGGAGSFAQLIHTNGALLTNAGYAALGVLPASRSNSVTLAGSSSRWWLGDGVLVGDGGSGNRLVVRDGASLITASISYFGDDTTSTNNEAVVTGPGSSWFTADYGLRVGYEGPNNRLLVSDGGMVTSFDDRIGNDLSSSNNQVLVTGPGSLWNNTRELTVGLNSSGNQLVVSNGGTVFTTANKYVGQNDGALGNTALVTGPGSAWLGDDSLYVGLDGSFNHLFVRNGARATSGLGTLGANFGADGNLAMLTDPGTRWLLSSNLYVGSNGAFSQLIISSGARVENRQGVIGAGLSSSNNLVLVTGPGSVWTNAGNLNIGLNGSANQLVVSNGGLVFNSDAGILSGNSSSSNNTVVITGQGSFWRMSSQLHVGLSRGGNRLVVTNGGGLLNNAANIGGNGDDNQVLVTGAGSTWTNQGTLVVGTSGTRSRLVVSDGGIVFAPFDIKMGESAISTNNRIVVDGGTLVMASSDFGVFDVRRGTNVLNAGLISVGQLLVVTNPLGLFEFNGGMLSTANSMVNNGQTFRVGIGSSPATFVLRNGTHSFANNIVVASNASLVGDGTIVGTLAVQPGGKISPGTSIGKIGLSGPPSLQGATLMEIRKDGTSRTNDQIQVTGTVSYGGTLTVSNLGPTALTAGDNFKLFSAGAFAGAFATVTLPPLNSGLDWTNKLTVDGSIEVVGAKQPQFAVITVSGSNVIISGSNGPPNAPYAVLTATNVAAPLSNWVSIVTNQFSPGGEFSFTNAITPGIPQRFYRLRTQ
jgi:fibronectin-binding autotransporter adhesin